MSISINNFDIQFLSYMQENSELPFKDVNNVFPDKSIVSLKRCQSSINYYLPLDKQLFCENDAFHCRINYEDFLAFLQKTHLGNYLSSVEERLTLIIFYCFLYRTVNTSRLYEEIGVSLTTKKKDMKVLANFLSAYKLELTVVNRKGISISGNETGFRIMVMRMIASVSELNHHFRPVSRAANNVYQRLMYQRFSQEYLHQVNLQADVFQEFIEEHELDLSYPGRKLLYIYLLIVQIRREQGAENMILPELNIVLPERNLFGDETENRFLNHFIISLDHNVEHLSLVDILLHEYIRSLIHRIQSRIVTSITQHQGLFDEVYLYVQKCIIRNKYNYTIYDNNLSKTHKHFPDLFFGVMDALHDIELAYQLKFEQNQVATLCLIFKKFIINNKLAGRNLRNVAIVTNSAAEKVSFFIASLKSYVEVSETATINIHEISRLMDFSHHLTIVFSNRISMLLDQQGIPHLKLNYYLQHTDIEKLLACGLSSNLNRKISADTFINDIRNISQAELPRYLRLKYGSHFL
ncbi:PRD domain-containing protein [Klebsiella aerogenes]|uniref:PRD domain-containing protein n=1 Tax=Klebsiella aerogenes TaxID=548 RepID=UPI00178C5ACD|nr:PRD domain-containing protein [Klebsiella aerogenes]